MRATKSLARTLASSTFGGVDQHGVAGGMAERVVDLLEAIEIDVEQRDAVPSRRHAALLEHLVEIAAVGQPGQRIVQRVVLDARMRRLEFGIARSASVLARSSSLRSVMSLVTSHSAPYMRGWSFSSWKTVARERM